MEPQDATTAQLTYCVRELTKMVMDLDERVKFGDGQIKQLELEVFELQKRADRHLRRIHLNPDLE